MNTPSNQREPTRVKLHQDIDHLRPTKLVQELCPDAEKRQRKRETVEAKCSGAAPPSVASNCADILVPCDDDLAESSTPNDSHRHLLRDFPSLYTILEMIERAYRRDTVKPSYLEALSSTAILHIRNVVHQVMQELSDAHPKVISRLEGWLDVLRPSYWNSLMRTFANGASEDRMVFHVARECIRDLEVLYDSDKSDPITTNSSPSLEAQSNPPPIRLEIDIPDGLCGCQDCCADQRFSESEVTLVHPHSSPSTPNHKTLPSGSTAVASPSYLLSSALSKKIIQFFHPRPKKTVRSALGDDLQDDQLQLNFQMLSTIVMQGEEGAEEVGRRAKPEDRRPRLSRAVVEESEETQRPCSVITTDDIVIKASLDTCIRIITPRDNEATSDLITTMIFVLRVYYPSEPLFHALLRRFHQPSSDVRNAVFKVLAVWMADLYDFDYDARVLSWVKSLSEVPELPNLVSPDNFRELQRSISTAMESGPCESNSEGNATTIRVSLHAEWGHLRDDGCLALAHIDVPIGRKELAEQLTAIASQKLSRTTCNAFVQYWTLKDVDRPVVITKDTPPQFKEVIKFRGFEEGMAQWVTHCVLQRHDRAHRVKTISFWLDVAIHCFDLRNYSTPYYIFMGVSCSAVSNMKQTILCLPLKGKAQYQRLKRAYGLFGPKQGYVREAMGVKNVPMIPHISIVQSDVGVSRDRILESCRVDELIDLRPSLAATRELHKFVRRPPYEISVDKEVKAWVSLSIKPFQCYQERGKIAADFCFFGRRLEEDDVHEQIEENLSPPKHDLSWPRERRKQRDQLLSDLKQLSKSDVKRALGSNLNQELSADQPSEQRKAFQHLQRAPEVEPIRFAQAIVDPWEYAAMPNSAGRLDFNEIVQLDPNILASFAKTAWVDSEEHLLRAARIGVHYNPTIPPP